MKLAISCTPLWPAALADPAGETVSLSEDVVCLPYVRTEWPAGTYTQGRRAPVHIKIYLYRKVKKK